ncbi:MAG: lasso peptide biosynthesis B2 protein [Proteobacteria bacterium]|nr:lasso peptide biosynthesis B2 protein [Pseudomonadota bacterium]
MDDGLVFLNLATGKYLAVHSADIRILQANVVGWTQPSGLSNSTCEGNESGDPAVLDALVAEGVLSRTANISKPPTPVQIRTTDALPIPTHAEFHVRERKYSHFPCLFASFAYVSLSIRRSDMHGIVTRLASLKAKNVAAGRRLSRNDLFSMTLRFLRMRQLLYTAREACLFDSLVLTHYLLRHRFVPTFVIGIATKPFCAHAWVQYDDCVLNDALDNVQPHTPLLAI